MKFLFIARLADWLTFSVLNLSPETRLAEAVHFFILDSVKILILLIVLIYLIAFVRASLDMNRIRDFLHGKNRFLAYFLASVLGAVTPFCSCSSIPVFIGFTAAGIPVGITMAFLITSPVINEVAILIMGAELGVRFMLAYLVTGIAAGISGGWFFDLIKADRFIIRPKTAAAASGCCCQQKSLTISDRHTFAWSEMTGVLNKIWYWVLAGIGIGAFLHGWVPAQWVQTHLSGGGLTVPLASLIAIPLYSDATAIIPIIRTMMEKGLPLGTALTFMLSVVGASLPGFVLLKQVMKKELLISFFCLLLVLFTLVGWLFNALEPLLLQTPK